MVFKEAFFLLSQFYLHPESTPLADPVRPGFHHSSILVNDLLDYVKAKSDSLTIDLRCSMKLTETSEELCHVFLVYTHTCVVNFYC